MKITFTDGSAGKWTKRNKWVVRQAVWDTANAEAGVRGTSPQQAFNDVQNGVNFTWGRAPDDGVAGKGCDDLSFNSGGCTGGPHQIYFMSLAEPNNANKSLDEANKEAINNVVHELGHAFAAQWYPKDPKKPYDPSGPYVNIPADLVNNNGFHPAPEGAQYTWRQHPCTANDCTPQEAFADMFLGWVYDEWDDDVEGVGDQRREFMNVNMAEWLK